MKMKFCPHSVFMCFLWIWEQTAIISLYSIDWLVGFYNWDGVCLLRGTFYILRSAHTVYLCVLCGSQNKQRLFQCTALTGWFCNCVCLLRGMDWVFKYKIEVNLALYKIQSVPLSKHTPSGPCNTISLMPYTVCWPLHRESAGDDHLTAVQVTERSLLHKAVRIQNTFGSGRNNFIS